MTKKLKGSGGGGGSGAKDNIFSTDWIEIVLGISEGEIKGIKDNSFKNVFIDGTAHTAKDGTKNFSNSDFNIVYDVGGANPKPIKYNLGGSSTTVTVGQEMFKDVPVLKVLPNAASTSFNQIEVRIMVNQLVRYNDEGGQKTSVDFKLEIKKDSEGVWKPFQTGKTQYTISGKTTQGVAYEYVAKLPNVVLLDGSDTYTLRATKLSDDSTDKHYRDITFATIDLVNTEGGTQEVHPNLAYVQFYGKLGEQISGVPEITAVWQGLLCSVPSNYNSTTRTYTGTWNGTFKPVKEFTNNPFWVIREMALNPRFGLASALKYLSVNDYEIYDLAKHADEPVAAGLNGELQPRFTFNGVLDKPMDGIELLNYIAGSAFARCYDDMQGQLRIIADRNDASVMLIVPESVISQNDTTFSYTKMDLRKRSNYITATYIDPDMNWQSQELVIKDDAAIDRFGRIESQQQLIGCTDRHEAYRKLKYLLTTGLTEIISVSFTMPMSGIMLKPYDVVDIADPDMGWALTGRIWSIAGKILSLRDPLTFDSAGTYTIRVQSASAGVITRTITIAQAGVYNSLTMNATITETLNQFSPFSIESPSNIGLSKPFRILRIDEVSGRPDVYSVTAIELNRNKFGDSDNAILTDGAIPAPEYGFKAPVKLDPVTDIVASNTRNKVHKLVDLYVTWTDSNIGIFNRSYVVTIRKEGKESWSRTFTTTTPWLEVEAIPVGELSISVQLQCSMGKVNSETLVFLSSYLSSEVIDLDWESVGTSSIVGGYDSEGDLVFQASMSYIQQSVALNLLLEPTIRNLRAHIFNGATEVTTVDSTDGNFRLTLAQNMTSNGGLAIDNLKVNITAIDINGTETSTLVSKTFVRDGIPDIEGVVVTPQAYGCRATLLYDEPQAYPPSVNWYLRTTTGAGYTAADLVHMGPSLNLGSLLANTTYYLWAALEGPYGDKYPKDLAGVAFTTPVASATDIGIDLEKTVYTYLRAASQPATPLGGTFSNPQANTNINPWSSVIPAENGLPLYVSSRTFYLGGAATTWAVPYVTTTPNWLSGEGAPAPAVGVVLDNYLDNVTGDIYKKTGVATWTLTGNIRGGDGDEWHNSSGVPAGALGKIGDYCLNTVNGDVYTKTGATTWTLTGNIKGIKGDTGTAGATWISGTVNPSAGLGIIGDFYLNTASGDTFKKTAADTWTLQGNIKGGDGDKWHSGDGAPAGVIGTIGDHYLNTATGDVYDKTGASTWTLTGNIKGTKGDQGTSGATWLSGDTNPAAGLGALGDFYLNTATGDTFKKTEVATWTLQGNIKGNDGDKWHSGAGVPDGAIGTLGDHYLDTVSGDVYDKTGISAWTLTGNIKGIKGDKGDTGTAGAVWLSGTANPATGLGSINDFYLNTASGDTFKKTAETVWTLQGNIKGGDGDKWHSGTTAPSSGLGTIGDHYLNTTNWDVYDKTGATTWTLTGNIKGAQGEDANFFDPTFSKGLNFWSQTITGAVPPNLDNSPGISIVPTGVKGGNSLRLDSAKTICSRYPIAIDPNKVYRVKARVRQITAPTVGGSSFYLGVVCLNENYQYFVEGVGAYRYPGAQGPVLNVANGWVEFSGLITGNVNNNHNTFKTYTKYVRPVVIVNYAGGNGVVEVDYIDFYEVIGADDLLVGGGWSELPVEPSDPRISNGYLQDQFNGANLAKTATFSSALGALYNANFLTDGQVAIGSSYTEVDSGMTFLQADLGQVRFLAESWAYFYAQDARRYHYGMATSIDGQTWEWVAGTGTPTGGITGDALSRAVIDWFSPLGAELPTIVGIFSFARYVRLYLNGSNANSGNHLYEWELWSSVPRQDPYPEQLSSGLVTPLTVVPLAPTITNISLGSNRQINITVVTAANDKATGYELWRSVGNTNEWQLLHSVTKQSVVNGGGFSYTDSSYQKRTAIYYRAYAVNRDTYSGAGINTFNVATDIPDPTNVTVAAGSFEYSLTWVNTTDNLLKSVEVRVQALATQSGFSIGASTVVYNGLGTSFTYEVPVGDRSKYHQFWLSSIEKT